MITASITDCLKKGEFHWSNEAENCFLNLKLILQTEPILKLPDFNLLFEIKCDASMAGLGQY